MSFVRIVEEKNPIEMHNKVYEASKNNALTPEFCMDILSHTNVPVIIGKMLEEIGKLPIEEQGQYIEVILSMFDKRLTSEKVRSKALEMAQNNGFESELNKVIKETGDGGYSAKFGVKDEMYVIDKAGDYSNVDFSSYNGVVVKGDIKDFSLFENNTLRGRVDLRGAKDIDLRVCDLSKVTKIIFEEGAVVNLVSATNLPKDLDLSMCDEVDLSLCDLKGINLKFREGAVVSLWGAENLPTNLDVSMCDKVNLNKCNLEGIKLKFREGAKIYLNETTNLPTDLDVSMCDYVNLYECNLEGICLKFREGAEVSLWRAKNLPKDLDVSMCDYVNLNKCNLEGINLKFREGAEVSLFGAKNLPMKLDVSMCDKVDMEYAYISKVKELKFKNTYRMAISGVKIPNNWQGNIIYTDDEKKKDVVVKQEENVSIWNKFKNMFGMDR